MPKYVVDFETDEKIGVYLKYKDSLGPCIFGKTEFKPDSSFKQRCLAAIASRESPIRSSKDPAKAKFPLVPGYSSTQSYEPWISIGMCHAISRNGNAQKLMERVFLSVPELSDKFREYGYVVAKGTFRNAKDDSLLTSKDIRSEHFCVALHKILEDSRTIQPQCDFFWKLIEERFSIVKQTGWFDAAMADERSMLIIASLAINAGVALFRRCLTGAKTKTAKELTDSRIREYKKIGANFGIERAKWEFSCSYVTNDKSVVL